MNEQQSVLDFFAKVENLPLGLAVAEQMDEVCKKMNNRLWRELLARFESPPAKAGGLNPVMDN
jgi:hypothetical protein